MKCLKGIKENAVDMVDNFDGTDIEPTLLPVAFPSVLINPGSGMAVGFSSDIPAFGLTEVCNATIGLMEGKITNTREMIEVIGAPEFRTGAFVHIGEGELERLIDTGRGTLTMSGVVELHKDKIVINELPHGVTIESILEKVLIMVKDGELRDVRDVDNLGDYESPLKGVINLKRGADPRAVLKKLIQNTGLRTKVSFNTRVIIDGELRELGITGLLNEWIRFRTNTVQRIHEFRLGKLIETENRLVAWEKLQERIQEVAKFLVEHKEDEFKAYLKNTFKLNDEQVEYIAESKAKEFTADRVADKLKRLAETREDMQYNKDIIESDDKKVKIIINELKEISKKYGGIRKTRNCSSCC